MNINPEDLIPKLPKPKDLQPFPTQQAIVSHQEFSPLESITLFYQWWLGSVISDQYT